MERGKNVEDKRRTESTDVPQEQSVQNRHGDCQFCVFSFSSVTQSFTITKRPG